MSTLRDALSRLSGPVFADLLEDDDTYLLVIDLPGATSDTTEVEVDGRILKIDARREKDFPASFQYLREDRSLFLDVELPLPPDATEDGASASLGGGVLEVRLPKRSASTGHRIEIEDD